LSPDGKQIAFTRSVEEKKSNIHLVDGGGEPIQLTKDKYGASNLNGPQTAKILFSSSIPRDLLQDSILILQNLFLLENGKAWF
jgi:Tol biopolymer transport system component